MPGRSVKPNRALGTAGGLGGQGDVGFRGHAT
jgi:hypothetical protein